ncbi:MAG: family 1 encapsulin nanocompartment shell protein [Bacteroidales bacterium]
MDILKQSLAPISAEAWQEIKSEAKRFLNTHLSARRFIEVSEPKGWDFASIPTGRLVLPDNQDKDAVHYGIHQVQPLVEPRLHFNLNIWELDNLTRGAKDIDLDAMEEAALKFAEFEERAIFYGMKNASITGLKDCNKDNKLDFPGQIDGLLPVISEGITRLAEKSISGPYALIVSPEKWKQISSHVKGYPLRVHLERILGGPVILSHFIEEAFLVPAHADDLNLILGQDISIGYESHNEREVRLYFTESFTMKINDPESIILIE